MVGTAHLNILSRFGVIGSVTVSVTEIWPRCHKGNVENEEAQKPNKEWHTTEPKEGHSMPPGDLQVNTGHTSHEALKLDQGRHL